MGNLFQELKRRKVFRVAAVYAVVAWLLIQVADTVLPALQLPNWTVSFITVLFILGFPIAIILSWAYDVTPDGVERSGDRQSAPTDISSSDRKLIYATFALVLLVAGFQITERFLPNGPPLAPSQSSLASPSVLRASILLDEQLARRFTGVRTQLALSPDGSQLLYGDMSVEGDFRIMLRNLETEETRVFNDSAQLGSIPEFSPDGQNVLLNGVSGFVVASLSGGSPQFVPVDEIASSAGSASNWLSNDEVLYIFNGNIFKKSLASSAEERLVTSDNSTVFTKPFPLPGGEAILYTSNEVSGRADFNDSIIELYNLDTGTSDAIIRGGYLPRYAPSGHIVFVRSGDLWAVPFSLENLEIQGREVRVIEGVDSQPGNGMASYAFSETGRLVYLAGPDYSEPGRPFSWIDRNGNEETIPLPLSRNVQPALSPDGSKLAFTTVSGPYSRDIYIFDFSRQSSSVRRTFTEDASRPIWHPDGDKIVYHRVNNGIWMANADGTGQPQQVLDTPRSFPYAFSSSDSALIYGIGSTNTQNLRTLVYQDSTWISSSLVDSELGTWGASISPDGRWIAYTNRSSSSEDIYVRPYPDTDSGGPWQISFNGGREPAWGPDSNEIFYLEPPFGELMSVAINTDSGFSPDTPKILLTDFSINVFEQKSYAASPDGLRFIRRLRSENEVAEDGYSGPTTLTVVENWFEELNRLAPADQN